MAVEQIMDVAINYQLGLLPPYYYYLTDQSDYQSLGISDTIVKGNFQIIDPLGQAYINTSWTTPDITLSLSNDFNTTAIRLNPSNMPFSGAYIFRYTVRIASGIYAGDYTKDFTVNYDYVRPTGSILFSNNPYTATLSARDTTNYLVGGVAPTQTRVFTLIYPALSGIPNDVSTGTYIVVSAPEYVNGLYNATLDIDLVYAFSTYSVTDNMTASNSISVVDIVNVKSVYCCLKKLNAQAVAIEKTNPTRFAELVAIINRATSLFSLFEMAITYGDYATADLYLNQIYAVTCCTKDCSC